jgi:hypothetical protein
MPAAGGPPAGVLAPPLSHPASKIANSKPASTDADRYSSPKAMWDLFFVEECFF